MNANPTSERQSESTAEVSIASVRDVMTWPVVMIESRATLSVALERFVGSRLRHLVVVVYEPDGRPRCIGVLADRHLAACWPLEPAMLEGRTVAEVLPHPQPYVRPGDSLEECGRDDAHRWAGSRSRHRRGRLHRWDRHCERRTRGGRCAACPRRPFGSTAIRRKAR